MNKLDSSNKDITDTSYSISLGRMNSIIKDYCIESYHDWIVIIEGYYSY